MAVDPARAKSLFLAASDLSETDRVAFLERECGDDVELRERVEALLHAEDAAPLPAPEQADVTATQAPSGLSPTEDYVDPTPRVGTLLADRYTLVEPIGAGGMGEVWVAKQTEPVKRKVALKLIKTGMDSRAVLARFEQERQALAMMDHPNIARVLDGGMTPTGQPFFVMELVNGLPLTRFCDEAKLCVRERLELFVPICQAVQHAHQKGIIHRDLKPANILVTLIDGRPVPKVIDFGVAKAIGGRLTDESISTQFGAVVGTLEYMSPEQAGYSGVDVDTRADVYSLGVILYELLTGLRPIDAKRLRQAALSEMIRILQEEEPSRPSLRLSTDESLPSLAALRQTEPKKLMALLRGELDWVVMKCLEKQRDRRYETANALSRDIQRYLADEAVEARPASTGYRLRKFVRRNRPQVIAASLVLLVLVAGVIGTAYGWNRAIKAQQAEAERAEGERLAKLDAEAKRAEAEREKRIANAVKDFLQHKLLSQADIKFQADALLEAGKPAALAKRNPTILELLDRAAEELTEEKIEENFPGQPLLQAELLYTVGNTYRGIGEYDRAIEFLERARDLDTATPSAKHVDTLTIMHALGVAYLEAGQFDKAVSLCERVFELREEQLGPDDPDTLSSLNTLAVAYHLSAGPAKSLPLFERVYQGRRATLGADDSDTLSSMNNLGLAHARLGNRDRAKELLVEGLELCQQHLGENHPDTLTSLNSLGWFYWQFGKTKKALKQFTKTLKLVEEKFGAEDPRTLSTKNNLASAYMEAGQLDDALRMYKEVLWARQSTLPTDHPATLTSMNNLATAYWQLNQLDKSIPLFEKALKALERKHGREHPHTALAVANLGVNYKDDDRVAEALPLLEEAYQASKQHPHLDWVVKHLLGAYFQDGKTSEAVGVVREMLDEGRMPENDVQLSGELAVHGLELLNAESFANAEPLLRASLAIREKQLPDSWLRFNGMAMLGGALLGEKKYAEAEPLLREGFEGMKKREKSIPPQAGTRIPEALDRLVALYTALEKPDEVKKWQAERAKYPLEEKR